MKIRIVTNELVPFYYLSEVSEVFEAFDFGKTCDVPVKTIKRWKRIFQKFEVVQEEMRKVAKER